MSDRLRVALVGGPMYDAVYEPFLDDVEVVVHADHLTLNDRVAELLAAGERIDVLSTHGKYAPSQRRWLRPLDDLLATGTVAAFEPTAVELCRDRGDLLCVPRNIDVRVLWWRTDRMDAAPRRWSDLLDGGFTFGFTGRGSGLFGLFYELVVGAGGHLFDDDGQPVLDPRNAAEAITTIRRFAERAPAEAATWHYDDVDTALVDGRVDCAAAWPGATAELRASPAADRLEPARYPAGRDRWVSYAGCHGWAIPTTCGDLDGAVALVEQLCSADTHRREASVGGIPARSDVLGSLAPADEVDAARLGVVRATIAEAMITYPALARFPMLETDGAAAINAVLTGAGTVGDAVSVVSDRLARVASPG